MENNTFKTVTFGGFDKQDVIRYIEQTAQENAAVLARSEEEKQALEQESAQLREQLGEVTEQLRRVKEENEALRSAAAGKQQAESELEELRAEGERLRAQLAEYQPLAEEYQKVKSQIGAIECEARKRANDLEEETVARLNRTLALCRAQYEALTSTFETASSHVTAELRKIEVGMMQMPRAMDQLGSDLTELETQLNQ